VSLWDETTYQQIGPTLEFHSMPTFDADAQSLFTVGLGIDGDHTIYLWDLSLSSWQERACYLVNRNFTPTEWRYFFDSTPYRHTCPNLAE
jgi:hypothetical protein